MIYLIGGAPGSGKSHLASRLSLANNSTVLELDILMPALNTFISSDQYAQKLPVWQAKRDGSQPTTSDYLAEAETYWPPIKSMLNYLCKYRKSNGYIVEGAQLMPQLVDEWVSGIPAHEKPHVKIVYLAYDQSNIGRYLTRQAKDSGFKALNRTEAYEFLEVVN